MDSAGIRAFFDGLNREYLALHGRKEELNWELRMGSVDARAASARAESAWRAFISSPGRLAAARAGLAELASAPPARAGSAEALEREELSRGLAGWRALFEANAEGPGGAQAMERLASLEAELSARRRGMVLRHLGERGAVEQATLGALQTNQAVNPDETARRSSFDALRGLETRLLADGLVDVVRARNELARGRGRSDYFDYKVRGTEAMRVEDLFAILDDFEYGTREANRRGLVALAAAKGRGALEPWNLRFAMGGDLLREMDRYFPLQDSLGRWAGSFARLGIGFRGASLRLDLLAREGKHQNGLCLCPAPAFRDRGAWAPADIRIAAEGRPGQVGAGLRALNTLFHEGGHAAHFANAAGNAPCFSQEYPPTSMVHMETQSLLCASLLEDADWLALYARTPTGSPMPPELVRERIERRQPFRAFEARMILVVPYFERELYALPDAELRPDRVLELARETERRILGVESPRPLVAIPHMLNRESAASFHSFLLADMAVCQTRAWLLRECGRIADNPAIGPLLAEKYWAPGNATSREEQLRDLTGEPFSARYLARDCRRPVAEAWAEAEASMEAALRRARPGGDPPSLDASVSVVDGERVLADNSISDRRMCEDFARVVEERRRLARL